MNLLNSSALRNLQHRLLGKDFKGSAAYAVPLLFCAAVLSYVPLYLFFKYGLLPYEDDAYYYFGIARNLHDLGASTFDKQTLTNGYHPLWLFLLSLQYDLVGSFKPTILLELGLVLGGLALLLNALKSRRITDIALLTLAYTISIEGCTLNGMETALLVFCFSALVWALERLDLAKDENAVLIGVAAALAVGARIDAAVFVLPLPLLALPSRRAKLLASATFGLLGFCYLVWNETAFGVAMPVSASVKSLGGLQINHHLLEDIWAQVVEPGFPAAFDNILNSANGNADYYRLFILIPGAIALLVFRRARDFPRTLLLAFLIGMLAYAAKLLFLSSWTIWPWYFFPEFIGAYACLRALLALLHSNRAADVMPVLGHALRFGALGLLATLIILPAESFVEYPPDYAWLGFSVINQRAVQRFGTVLAGERVAMGDRAGSFAFNYNGPVTQLEGLVEDKRYLQVLAAHGDMHELLCRRGVKYIAAYATDLGRYKTHSVDVLRPWLTDFSGPQLTVRKEDEVGRIFDLDVFDSAELGDEGDSYLYVWRLSGCGTQTAEGAESLPAP